MVIHQLLAKNQILIKNMLAQEKKNKLQKNEHLKDVCIAVLVLIISIGCFFTYNPADAPLQVGTDGMTFATYPLGVASLLTILGTIYFIISLKKYLTSNEKYNLFGYILKAIKDNRSLYFKRIGTVVLLVAFALILGKVNFLIVTSVFLFLGFYLYDRRDYIFMIILSVLGGLFSYGLFVYFLKLPI